MDLLDLWRGRLSFRKLELLIRDLPPDSRLWRTVDPDAAEAASWGTLEYLYALHIDLFGKANYKNYEPLERPHQRVERRQRAAALHAALLAQRERQRLRELQRAASG